MQHRSRRFARLTAGIGAMVAVAALAALPAAAAPSSQKLTESSSAAPSSGTNTIPPPQNCVRANGSIAPDCFGLVVSPARIVVTPKELALGKAFQFKAINNGNTTYHLQVFAVEFSQQENGSLALGNPNARGEAGSWVQISPATGLDLTGGQQKGVSLRIKPPSNASAGDHNIAIIFRKPANTTSGNIHVAPQIGAQLLAQIPGPVVNSVSLTDGKNTTDQGVVGSDPGFGSAPTQTFTVRVHNNGTVHRDFYPPKGQLTGKVSGTALFGSADATLTAPQFTVLRGGVRQISLSWNNLGDAKGKAAAADSQKSTGKPPLVCFCKVTVQVADGKGGYTTQTISFTIFPFWLLLVLVVVVLVLVVGLFLLLRRRKHRKAAAVAAAADRKQREEREREAEIERRVAERNAAATGGSHADAGDGTLGDDPAAPVDPDKPNGSGRHASEG